MISFTVTGTPVAQGSYVAFCPVSPNADIDEAVHYLGKYLREHGKMGAYDRRTVASLTDRLAAIGEWPTYMKHKPGAKTPGHFVATMHASNAGKLNKWRNKIAAKATLAYRGPQIFMPVSVDATFTFIRPAAHWRSGDHSSELHKWAPKYHTSIPDRDKLLRAVLDALTQSGVIVDDKIVAATPGENLWSNVKDDGDGVSVMVTELPESDACRAWARKRYEKRKNK